MIGRVKRWLGIEGVKLEHVIPDEIESAHALDGKIRFYSMHAQTVQRIRVSLVEKYKRGRRKQKLIDEYQLGTIELDADIEVPADEIVEVDFSLPFSLLKSDVDLFADKNIVFKGIAAAARFAKGARSEYKVVAEAKVKGTALNPFDSRLVKIV